MGGRDATVLVREPLPSLPTGSLEGGSTMGATASGQGAGLGGALSHALDLLAGGRITRRW